MSLIKNSIYPLIDLRPKAVPDHTLNKDFHIAKQAEGIMKIRTGLDQTNFQFTTNMLKIKIAGLASLFT